MSPIRNENKNKYPPRKEWLALRERILTRGHQRCEFCGVANHDIGHRNSIDVWVSCDCSFKSCNGAEDHHDIMIVLTIAHLDHNPANNSEDNLRALCQRCHNRYDAKTRRAGIAERKRADLGPLFQGRS